VFGVDYYYELFGIDMGALSSRVYAGATLEVGNTYLPGESITWPSLRQAAAIYIGAETPLGPVYLGGGWTDSDRTRLYLIIGQQF